MNADGPGPSSTAQAELIPPAFIHPTAPPPPSSDYLTHVTQVPWSDAASHSILKQRQTLRKCEGENSQPSPEHTQAPIEMGRCSSQHTLDPVPVTLCHVLLAYEVIDQKAVYFFNLTSIQDSEMILTATFHFYSEPPRWPRAREMLCKPRAKNVSCRLLSPGPPARQHLLFRSLSQNTTTQGLLRGAVALVPPPRGLWQAKDISPIVKAARRDGELLLSAQLDYGERDPGVHSPSRPSPYILVYADDLAISEPNSVAVTLQRYDPFPAGDPELHAAPNSSADPRVRRAAQVTGPLQDNELPGLHERPAHAPHAPHYHEHELWSSPFRALKPRPGRKDRRKKGQDTFLASSQVLDFDEKTMQKARRKQWDEPRVCSRRYLKVDFADIGWNEWIISPKSFDAYYCAGTCEFPMPKVVRPSNHATIQSIVRAVGIVPGIPEPCCVPDKMNSLGVLFLDENRNVVLKVYPNMSVETCACR
ncbi:PREDICTED: bone morphogenetic protein 3B [Galeopterus variegatus]|uniref:Growth/differentiation factor 10 n=1 Tax=Galeopterus variegatus TaxID=482537 RepID=A0ABM0RWE0_GALVR|nr:PREDICTED: bone morphogenetic protein 3B [Galeopterus variegatus]